MDINKVLIADAVDKACVELLQNEGITVDCKYKLSEVDLIKEITEYDGLIVRSDTKVTANVINSAQKLKVIGRAGAGVDNIDIKSATNKKIIVLNTPGGNSISACELTCSLITVLARNVVPAAASLRAGRWDRKLYAGHELAGKTLGVLGLGRIGREVARRMRAWDMTLVGYDPIVSVKDAEEFGVKAMSIEEVCAVADYITVHTPLIPQTKGLINSEFFANCKPGVRIINVARGGIVNSGDLLAALVEGKCAGAALDVYDQEPPNDEATLALIAHDNVVATPHLGASTAEAQIRVAVEVAEQFVALTGRSQVYQTTPGIVNKEVL